MSDNTFQPAMFDLESGNAASDLPEVLPSERTVMTSVLSKDTPTTSSWLSSLFVRVSKWTTMIVVMFAIVVNMWRLSDAAAQRLGRSLAPRGDLCPRQVAVNLLIKAAQLCAFPSELTYLTSGHAVSSNSSLASLSPFLDEYGVIRVGGRLAKSPYSVDVKHPVIIPQLHPLTTALFNHFHEKSGHQGRQITRGALSDAGIYILHGSSVVKKLIRECVTCRRIRGKLVTQKMADLPEDRVAEIPPFYNCGIDVAGPWYVRDGVTTRRRSGRAKVWLLMFTCLASRAVHIELLYAMDTAAFILAYKRFVALRGSCKLLRSDRGSNFIGASNISLPDKEVMGQLSVLGCRWEFNPPCAPHFGGVWERKIGQVKRGMDAALLAAGNRLLSPDEFSTLVQEAAAVVNSTPLWEISSDPNDPVPLSPAMLLTGRQNSGEASASLVDAFSAEDIAAYGKRRWRRVMFMADQFWKSWRQTYLQTLQHRRRWLEKNVNLAVGDIVLIKDANMPRRFWPIGRVNFVRRSRDGLVRSASMKTVNTDGNTSSVTRPISELVLLQTK